MKEDCRLQFRARAQRPNEDFEAFEDNFMELVGNTYPEATYSFKVELERDQFVQGVAISDDLQEKAFMSQPASLVEAVRVVHRLESALKACQAVPSVEKKKSLNVVIASADVDKISTEIRELKEIVLDTGATVSVLNEERWKTSGHVTKVNPVTGTLTTANGNELTVLVETKHFGCQIHFDTGTFVVGHTEIPIRFCKVTPNVCRICLSEDIIGEPGTEQVFEAKLENGYDRNTGTPGISEASMELREKSDITIARFLVISRDGLTIFRVVNFTDRSIRLRSDFSAAEYHPISSVDGCAVSMETDPNFASASHPSCTVVYKPEVRDEQPVKEEKVKSSLQGDLEVLSESQRGQFLSLVIVCGLTSVNSTSQQRMPYPYPGQMLAAGATFSIRGTERTPVVDQLLREWKKLTDGEPRPLSRAIRRVWAQWELLELREGVLYLRSPERTPSAKSRMVLPQKLVEEPLMEVHDGLTGAQLGRLKTLKKMKTRRWQEGIMEKKGAREAADAPQGGNGVGEQVQATLEGVVSMEPDTTEEVVWAAARSEGYNEVVDMPNENVRGDPLYLLDSVLGEKFNRVLEVTSTRNDPESGESLFLDKGTV
ncbi:hypothetical protein AWC38_SpisGene5768 [Stylophora pistillata]|uniref:Peptidase A2 domain-containing protein n=1 Tax=Stylophora pistillata TaxID=50429 RepID=A0A2B4SLS8_STYPI|nr:hypothetical protein AWC38_SpisGene5768 [Stylophora pistillata]